MQKLLLRTVVASVLALSATQAFAAAKIEAKLAAPVEKPRQVIVDGQIWRCTGDVCTSPGGGQSQSVKRECARAAKVLGEVVAYRNGKTELAEADIAACNGRQ